MVRVGAVSAQAYPSGPGGVFAAMLQAGSPKQLADQMLYLDQVAAVQEDQIHDGYELKLRDDSAKAPIDALDTPYCPNRTPTSIRSGRSSTRRSPT